MTYKLIFIKPAKKEWDQLDNNLQKQFKNKLLKRLDNPIVIKDRLSGAKNYFKIKLRSSGYRLIYRVIEKKIVVEVVAIGKRDNEAVYNLLYERINK